MKKILLIHQDQKFIGDMQIKFAHRYEILAIEDYNTAYRILKTLPIDLVLARLPPLNFEKQIEKLKKLQKKKFAPMIRLLSVAEEGDSQIKEFLK